MPLSARSLFEELEGRVPTSWGDWARTAVPVVLAAAVVVAVAWPWIEPAPPTRVVIATGPAGSTYNAYAETYRQVFAEQGVELVLRETGGARENYALLADPASGVDVALVQGGTAPPAEQRAGLEAVCAVSLEPLFVVYRAEAGSANLEGLLALRGKRVAVGSPRGGTYWVATPLLAQHGLWHGADGTTFVEQSGAGSATLLKEGKVDAAFFAVDANTPYLVDLLRTPNLRLMSLPHARAYASRFGFVRPVTIPRGVVDLARDAPPEDVETVAAVTAMIARKRTHKAIVGLLVQAAEKAHRGHNPLAGTDAFPTLASTELPVGDEARYYFNNKPGLLQRKLPFWAASLLDRLLILIVPLVVVLIPLLRFAPALYAWQVRRRIYKWYRVVRRLDERTLDPADGGGPAQRAVDRDHVERLERELAKVKVPLSYSEELYNLRLHVAMVRDRLDGAAGRGPGPAGDGPQPDDTGRTAGPAVAR